MSYVYICTQKHMWLTCDQWTHAAQKAQYSALICRFRKALNELLHSSQMTQQGNWFFNERIWKALLWKHQDAKLLAPGQIFECLWTLEDRGHGKNKTERAWFFIAPLPNFISLKKTSKLFLNLMWQKPVFVVFTFLRYRPSSKGLQRATSNPCSWIWMGEYIVLVATIMILF